MTAATSTSKKSFFGAHCRNKLKELRQLTIVNSVLQLLGLPLIAGAIIYSLYLQELDKIVYTDAEGFVMTGVFALALSLISGIIIALHSFRYLYTRSLVDMNYSLPLTSKQRFAADFFTGLGAYIVPAAAGALLSLIILGIGSAFVDLKPFWNNFPQILTAGFIVLIGMIFLYSVCVFAITCSGAGFDAVFGIIAINVIIPVTIICGHMAIVAYSGMGVVESGIFYNPIFTTTSPAGICAFFVTYIEYSFSSFLKPNSTWMFVRWLIPVIIIVAAIIAVTFLLYKKRKAEDVSKPYVFKLFYYAVVTLGVFCVLVNFIIYDINLFTGLLICAIIYFLMEVVSKRGFKRFWVSVLRYGATVAAVFLFCMVCDSTYGFGTAKYVPRPFAVDGVVLDIYGGQYAYFVGRDEPITDERVIKDTTSLHKEIVSRMFEPEKFSTELVDHSSVSNTDSTYTAFSSNSVSITYYLNNGSTVMRHYDCSSDMLTELVTAINLSDEYAAEKAESLTLECINYASNYNFYYNGLDQITSNTAAEITLRNKFDVFVDSKVITGGKIKELYEAYKTDLLAMTEEEYKTSPVYGYISYSNHAIRTSFLNTIEFLEREGFKSTELSADMLKASEDISFGIYDDFEAVNSLANYYRELLENNVNYYGSGSNIYYKQDGFISELLYQNNSYPCIPASELDYNDDLMAVIERATPIIVGESAAGALYYEANGSYQALFLPDTEENKELLSRVYKAQFEDSARYTKEDVYFYYD